MFICTLVKGMEDNMALYLNGREIMGETYPNGELIFKLPMKGDYSEFEDNIQGVLVQRGVPNTAEVVVTYDSRIVEKMVILGSYLQKRNIELFEPSLSIYYFPYLRMDRDIITDEGQFMPNVKELMEDVIFTYFKGWSIDTFDNHSEVDVPKYTEFIDRLVDSCVAKVVEQEGVQVICYPDAGATRRYHRTDRDLPVVTADKKRNTTTGQIEGIELNSLSVDLTGKTVLVVDDICSKGGTFMGIAKLLKEKGASRIICWFSHTEDTIFGGDIFKTDLIDHVYTTDSIDRTQKHERLTVV